MKTLSFILFLCAVSFAGMGPPGNYHWKAPVANSGLLVTPCVDGDAREVINANTIYTCQSNTWTQISASSAGTVTSVGLAEGSSTPIFNITGSPVTGTGTLTETLKTQTANTVLSGPTTGAAAQPTFRALVAADVPSTFVQGPASSANNEVVVFSGTGGKTIKSSGQVLLDPSTRILSYGSQPAFDIPNRYLYTGGGSLGIGLTQSILYYQDGTTPSVSWNDSRLFDSGGTTSVDWGSEKLYYGSQAVVDWKNQVLFDIGGIISMDWSGQRAAYDSAGIMALSWSNNSHRLLYDSSSVKSQDWEARQQYDNGGALAHDWQVRGFYDGAGILSLAYESRYLSDEAGNPKLYWNATGLNAPSLTRNQAVYINNSNYFATSTTTDVELGYLSGTTSSVQTQLNTKEVSQFDHFADANNTTTTETDLYSDTLTAGKLATNGDKVFIDYGGTFTGAATATQRLKIYFGGTVVADTGALAVNTGTPAWGAKTLCIRESSSVVRCNTNIDTGTTVLSASSYYTRVTGLTLSNTQVIKITGTAAGAGAASSQITATQGNIRYLSH